MPEQNHPFTNRERAECARRAVHAYSLRKENTHLYDPVSDVAGDLLCDLLHLIRAEGLDPAHYLRMAEINFEAEETEEA